MFPTFYRAVIQIKAAADNLRDPGSCMIQVIDQLGRDHRNMRLLLDIVEAEMTGYRAGRILRLRL